MRSFLLDFVIEFEYPQEARIALLECYDKLMASDGASTVVRKHLDNYEQDVYDHNAMLSEMTEAAFLADTPWQTAHLVMGILLSKELRERYRKRNIDDQIWIDTVGDFKCKLFECHNVYHIWGSFVGHWWKKFFSMNIFGIGRLQYEMSEFGYTYQDGNVSLTPDMKALSIHIPSSGPLTKDLRIDSYSRAKKFFADYFGEGPSLFKCSSWLLYPEHENMLSPKSNVLSFMHDFKIIDIYEPEKSNDLWRIFDDAYVLPYELLPRNNSMRKAYAERLCEGKRVGRGVGFFII